MTELIDSERRLILDVFLASTEEHLQVIEQALLALDGSSSDRELYAEILRRVHTIKGDSASVGLEPLVPLMHAAEALLQELSRGEVPPSPNAMEALLSALDFVAQSLRWTASGEQGDPPEPAGAIERLEREALATQPEEALAGVAETQSAARAERGDVARTERKGTRFVRVGSEKVDRIVDWAGEVAVAWSRVAEMIGRLGLVAGHDLLGARDELSRVHLALQDELMTLRMVPVGPMLRRQLRVVRDLSLQLGKPVRLRIEGEHECLDATLVERIGEPLTHLIRNAIDHGIESSAEREGAGKSVEAALILRASSDTGFLVIDVEDDGRGIDEAELTARVREHLGDASWRPASPEALLRWVFEPGLSTVREVNQISGRGVGLDVVKREVDRLGGQVELCNRPKLGLRVSLRLPLTLAVIDGLEVRVAGEPYVVPMAHVVECLDFAADPKRPRSGVHGLRGEPLPWIRLRSVLGSSGVAEERENLIVVRNSQARFGLVVDRVIGERPTVVKPAAGLLRRAREVAGSTVLASGQVALILDVPALWAVAGQREGTAEARGPAG